MIESSRKWHFALWGERSPRCSALKAGGDSWDLQQHLNLLPLDISGKVTAGTAGIGLQGLVPGPVADTSSDLAPSNITGHCRWWRGWWSLSHRIKRCLSASNPVKSGVSGRMMGHLFNEVCQQTSELKAFRLTNIQSLTSWPWSKEAQIQLLPQYSLAWDQRRRRRSYWCNRVCCND